MAAPRLVRWYSSFYWRIGISFVVFVVVVLVAQSLMVGYARSSGAFAPGNPNGTAGAIASELGSSLTNNPDLDIAPLLTRAARGGPPAYVVMTDGRLASTSQQPLRPTIERQVKATLAGVPQVDAPGDMPTGPVVTAPIQVGGSLAGMVVLPPPPPRGLLANVGELLTLPGTLALVAITAVAAFVIFAPARNRLRALERAAERLGAGQLDTRARVQGRDEIARVAAAFNHMAVDLERQTEALRLSDRLRRQMLADISHELRTPLTTMRGYLDTLDMPEIVLDEDKRKRYIETARRETLRLERIVLDLLDLTRFESGVAAILPRVVAVERVLGAVARRFERDASMANVTIRTRVEGAVDQIVVDPDRLDQAISNLVTNALRHTPPGGTIDLVATAAERGYQLMVIDSGGGIAPEHAAHVFDRFYKVDASRASGAGGSGLGLSIAKAIVEHHGGTISVTSEPGRTAFIITMNDQSRSANL
jgi:two-component system, OmpR family, sensor kinase